MIQILKQDKETVDHILGTLRSGLFESNHKSADTDEERSVDTSQWIDYSSCLMTGFKFYTRFLFCITVTEYSVQFPSHPTTAAVVRRLITALGRRQEAEMVFKGLRLRRPETPESNSSAKLSKRKEIPSTDSAGRQRDQTDLTVLQV